VSPPYSVEFVDLFLPIVENEEITGTMRCDGDNDPVSEFIGMYTYKYFICTYVLDFYHLMTLFFSSTLQRNDNLKLY